jgi:hypothetical protein
MSDVQGTNGQRGDGIRNELRRGFWKSKCTKRKFDSNFPGAGRGQIQFGRAGRKQVSRFLIELVLRAEAPKKDAGIQQVFHAFFLGRLFLPSKDASSSSGRGASKSSEIVICPANAPSFRLALDTGTSRATGTPRFAMVISSPAATRCRRRENCVLASWVFTAFMVSIMD